MYTKMLSHLKDLNNSSAHIEASALVSIDGLVIAATFSIDTDMDVDNFGAVCAGAFLLGHQTSEKCASGALEQMSIKCSKSHIIITHVSTETILVISIKPCADIEQISPSVKHCIEKIAAM